jgi:hypothetical protein
VFGCGSAVVVEGACVRNCRGLGVCMASTVGYSVGGKCVGEKGNVVTNWGRRGEGGKDNERE